MYRLGPQFGSLFHHGLDAGFLDACEDQFEVGAEGLRARLFDTAQDGTLFQHLDHLGAPLAVRTVKQQQVVALFQAHDLRQIAGLVEGGGDSMAFGQRGSDVQTDHAV